MQLIELYESAMRGVLKRHARRIADDIQAKGDPYTAKFWAKHLSKQTAGDLAQFYNKGYDVIHDLLIRKIIKYLGENMDTNTAQKQPEVFVDLDGVLVDFVKLAKQMVSGWEDDSNPNRDKKLDRELWKQVGWGAKRGKQFWGNMDPLPDAYTLWNYIKKYDPQILSAMGVVGRPDPEKRAWVSRHIGQGVKVNLVTKAVDKAQFAAPGRILIDDKRKAIDPWIAAGGIGILHTSAANTIARLKELGL